LIWKFPDLGSGIKIFAIPYSGIKILTQSESIKNDYGSDRLKHEKEYYHEFYLGIGF
jgi:hypothetical protein